MAGKAERDIDADEERLVGDRVEIGPKLAPPAVTFGNIPVGRVRQPREQKEHERRGHLVRDDQPHHERNEHDPNERQAVGNIHEHASRTPFAPRGMASPGPEFSRFSPAARSGPKSTRTEYKNPLSLAESEPVLAEFLLQALQGSGIVEGNGCPARRQPVDLERPQSGDLGESPADILPFFEARELDLGRDVARDLTLWRRLPLRPRLSWASTRRGVRFRPRRDSAGSVRFPAALDRPERDRGGRAGARLGIVPQWIALLELDCAQAVGAGKSRHERAVRDLAHGNDEWGAVFVLHLAKRLGIAGENRLDGVDGEIRARPQDRGGCDRVGEIEIVKSLAPAFLPFARNRVARNYEREDRNRLGALLAKGEPIVLQELLDRLLVHADIEGPDVARGRVLLAADRHAADETFNVLLGQSWQIGIDADRQEALKHGFHRAGLRFRHAHVARGDRVRGGDIDGNLGDVVKTVGGARRAARPGDRGKTGQKEKPGGQRVTSQSRCRHVQLRATSRHIRATPCRLVKLVNVAGPRPLQALTGLAGRDCYAKSPAPSGPVPATPKDKAKVTYRDAGVDIDTGNALVEAIGPLAAATKRAGALGGLGGFGGLFDLKTSGFNDPVLVAATDGVGTKLKLAIETGRHDGIGIDLVAMNVNDIVVQGAEPLFFLDYFACGKLELGVATTVIGSIARGCTEAGCALIGGETAEMPGLYDPGDYDLAGFAVGAVERDRLLPRTDIEAGDVILALPSSGIHANGFSLVRRIVADAGLRWNDPAPFARQATLGEILLTPTRIYVRQVLETIRRTGAVKALAHITGGGLIDNIPRVLPQDLTAEIDLAALRS